MLIGSLLRFSSNKNEAYDNDNTSWDDLTPKTDSKKLASLTGHAVAQDRPDLDYKKIGLDELAEISRNLLLDENLEVSKVRPFFWTLVETYVDRFHVFPFDAVKALFSCLELHDYPEEEVRDLVKRLEKRFKKQHGKSMHESAVSPAGDVIGELTLDQEINELRQTLKYAAIVGERIDD